MPPTVSTPLQDMYGQTVPNFRVVCAWARQLLPYPGHAPGWHVGLEVGGRDPYAVVPEAGQMTGTMETVLWCPLTGFADVIHTVSVEGLA